MSEMIRPSAEKLKALQLAMEKIDKAHGKGTVMKLGERLRYQDRLTGVGFGFGCGRLSARTHHRDLRSGVVG